MRKTILCRIQPLSESHILRINSALTTYRNLEVHCYCTPQDTFSYGEQLLMLRSEYREELKTGRLVPVPVHCAEPPIDIPEHPIENISLSDNVASALSLLNHVVWLCGYSGSGKTTTANSLASVLYKYTKVYVLDEAEFRKGLGWDAENEEQLVSRAAYTAQTLADCGITVICAFRTSSDKCRQLVADIVPDVQLVQVQASPETCKGRTGKKVSDQLTTPLFPHFSVCTEGLTPVRSAKYVLEHYQIHV